MKTLLWILLATILDGLLGLSGVITLKLREKTFRNVIFWLVAFASGAMFAGGLFHLFLESLHEIGAEAAVLILMGGFIFFFLMERIMRWHHCHEGHCKVHPISSLIVLGDGLHNFIDGLIMAVTFIAGIPLGIITSLMIFAHEIPQELGNFAVLIHSKVKRGRALLLTFLSQITCVLGGITGYFLRNIDPFKNFLMPFAAGGFLYISASDLIPELHKEAKLKKSLSAFALFLTGIIFMIAAKLILE
ncbi:MAG: ZIP family metal transporter [Candidatus Woesearchaeota archaeon]